MNVRSFGVGFAPDVAWIGDRGFLIVRENDPRQPGQIAVWSWVGEALESAHVLFSAPHAGTPGFPKIHTLDGLLWCAYHDGAIGHLWNITSGHHIELNPCQNNDPICFGDRFVAWQGAAADGWPITRLDLRSGEAVDAGRGQGTGLSRVLPDGTVVLIDADRFALPGATRPCFAGDLAVGEHPTAGVIWQLGADRGLLWPGVEVFTPHCADNGSRVAICGWSLREALLWVGTGGELPRETPQPEPQPQPEPEPEPQPMPDVWTNRLDVAKAVDRDYPQLLERARREGERFRGDFVDQLAHRLNRIDRTDRWGRKARRLGDAASLNDDALTYRLTDDPASKKLIDVVGGDNFNVQWDVRPAHEEPGNGFWHPPLNADLDGTEPEPEPQPEPEPAPQPDVPTLKDVYQAVTRLQQSFDRVFR